MTDEEHPVPDERRGRLVLLAALGASLVVAAIASALFLWVDAVSYRHWPSDAEIVGDGTSHQVDVEAGEPFLLWKWAVYDSPDCTATALPSGEQITLDDVSADGWHRGGGAVHYEAFAEGRTDSESISVQCTSTPTLQYDQGPDRYYVDGPHGPPVLDTFGPWTPAPLALLAVGLFLVTGAVVRRWALTRRHRRALDRT